MEKKLTNVSDLQLALSICNESVRRERRKQEELTRELQLEYKEENELRHEIWQLNKELKASKKEIKSLKKEIEALVRGNFALEEKLKK